MKSKDTEEWLDVYFTRPIGLMFALFWNKLGVHPNAITILSIFLGVGSAFMFYYTDLWHNIAGILLLMFANFCDSTDGQMARLTGKKTLIGRMLDGFAGDLWFFAIYVALCLRMQGQFIPGTTIHWGIAIWVMAIVAGVFCHSPQSSLADYYRQIHLFFLKGKEGSELDNYASQRAIDELLPKSKWLDRLFYYNYANYCKSQEKRTPMFQRFYALYLEICRGYEGTEVRECENTAETEKLEGNLAPSHPRTSAPSELSLITEEFLSGSRPLMKFTNILTFNVRAITIYVTCLLNIPWVYFLVEILILSILYIHMHRRHEALCERLAAKIQTSGQ